MVDALVGYIANQVNIDATLFVTMNAFVNVKTKKSYTLQVRLARTLGSLLQMTQLNCLRNFLCTGDCTALAKAFKHNSAVTQLDSLWNKLGTGYCSALAEAIKRNKAITQLKFVK